MLLFVSLVLLLDLVLITVRVREVAGFVVLRGEPLGLRDFSPWPQLGSHPAGAATPRVLALPGVWGDQFQGTDVLELAQLLVLFFAAAARALLKVVDRPLGLLGWRLAGNLRLVDVVCGPALFRLMPFAAAPLAGGASFWTIGL